MESNDSLEIPDRGETSERERERERESLWCSLGSEVNESKNYQFLHTHWLIRNNINQNSNDNNNINEQRKLDFNRHPSNVLCPSFTSSFMHIQMAE